MIMKKILKVLQYTLLGIILLLITGVISLNLYYNKLFESKTRVVYDNVTAATFDPRKKVTGQEAAAIPDLNLIPYPQQVIPKTGIFKMPANPTFGSPPEVRELIPGFFKRLFNADASFNALIPLFNFIQDDSLPKEGYNLDISPLRIEVTYSDPQGLYYSLVTVKQLNKASDGKISCVEIEDYPDMEIRGVMLDISRNKIPTLETLLKIADYLSELKINHFQLYVEGFSFGYPSFKELWENTATPITPEEIRDLDQYCRDRFIDLTPNQNSLGHMMAWLETEKFKDLAECPGGYTLMPFFEMKGTLDPYDPRSIELVGKMMDDMLPNFTSVYFNANMDEPFELGLCKTKKQAEEKGVGHVYLEYAMKVNELTHNFNKKMMMWGDVVSRHSDIIPEIPEDITILEWGYEAEHPFDEKCKKLAASGLDFLICPGTSSWTTFTGRTDNMFGNIYNAVTNGVKYGAKGMLLTDWGDMGHWQYLPVSYPGYATGAALSWNAESGENLSLEKWLDANVFMDDKGKMGSLVLDLGRYNKFEEFLMPNMTLSFFVYQFGLVDVVMHDAVIASVINFFSDFGSEIFGTEQMEKIKIRHENKRSFAYTKMMVYLDLLEKDLDSISLKMKDAKLVKDEFRNGIRMIRLGAKVKNYIVLKYFLSPDERIRLLEEMKKLCSIVIDENKRLWLSRNRPGGLDPSMQPIIILQEQIDDEIALMNKGPFVRKLNRLLERTMAAAVALYLR